MSRRAIAMVLSISAGVAGCYQGSVYSQYTELALSAAVRPEEGVPARVNFGYDRGAVAFVSKLESGSYRGEAASLISKESIAIVTDPRELDGTLLQVDAAFISGNAAIVAAVPANRSWKVVDEHDRVLYDGTASGEPGERIAVALSATDRFACAQQRDIDARLAAIDAGDDATFEKIASALPDAFRAKYAQHRAIPLPPSQAFRIASLQYTQDDPACGPRLRAIADALAAAQD